MPLRDYKCRDCEHEERDRLLLSKEQCACEKCGSANVEFPLSARVGWVLKGGGWAFDGYSKGRRND